MFFYAQYMFSKTVELEIRRNRGSFGRITVLYEVEASGADGTNEHSIKYTSVHTVLQSFQK